MRKTPEEFLNGFGPGRVLAQKIYNLEIEKMKIDKEWRIMNEIEKAKRLTNAGCSLCSMLIFSLATLAGASVKPFSWMHFMLVSILIYNIYYYFLKASKLKRKKDSLEKNILKIVKKNRNNPIWIDVKNYLSE